MTKREVEELVEAIEDYVNACIDVRGNVDDDRGSWEDEKRRDEARENLTTHLSRALLRS